MLLKTALICLAMNVYHEARDQSTVGQIAVAQVVINRVNDNRYPDSVCKVVKQSLRDEDGLPIKDKCQFSWYCDGASDKVHEKEAWKKSLQVAKSVLHGKTTNLVGISTHYHADSVYPYWAKEYKRIAKIDDHIFYEWSKK